MVTRHDRMNPSNMVLLKKRDFFFIGEIASIKTPGTLRKRVTPPFCPPQSVGQWLWPIPLKRGKSLSWAPVPLVCIRLFVRRLLTISTNIDFQDEYSLSPQLKHVIGIHGYVLIYSVNSRNSFNMIQIFYDQFLWETRYSMCHCWFKNGFAIQVVQFSVWIFYQKFTKDDANICNSIL